MKCNALSLLGERTTEPPISWLMKTALEHPGIISLAAGFTDSETLPRKITLEVLREILGDATAGQAALQYGSTAGDPGLMEATAALIRSADGAEDADLYSPCRMIITHGSQQFLYLITEVLCNPGDIVLVEDPTYFVYLGIAQSHGLRCRGIPLEKDGLSLTHLEKTLEDLKHTGGLKRLKFLYLVSYYQNPTGTTTCLAKKAAALELLGRYERAAGHPIYLLEDAAYRGLRFAGADVPSALTVKTPQERVIYSSTYSKPFATGVRVGYALLPWELIAPVTRVKGNHDFGTAHLLQKVLARVVASGKYEQHVQLLRRRYAQKAALMADAIRWDFPEAVQWTIPEGGLYFWTRLPKSVRTSARSRLFQEALGQKVLYVPGGLCYADDPTRKKPEHEMRISYGHAREGDIREGIKHLGAAIHKILVKK